MRNRKRWYPLLLAGMVAMTVLVTARVTSGQAGVASAWPVGRTAVVDVVRIFNEFQQTQDLNALLQAKGDEIRKQIEDKTKGLEAKRDELAAFQKDSQDYQTRFNDLMKQDIQLRTESQFVLAQVEAENRVWLKRTYQQILDAVQQVAQERGIDLVMYTDEPQIEGSSLENMQENIRKRKVLWANPQLDVTGLVLERLNRDYQRQGGKASIKLPF